MNTGSSSIIVISLVLCVVFAGATSCVSSGRARPAPSTLANAEKSEPTASAQLVKVGDAPFQGYVKPPILRFINQTDGWLVVDRRLWRTRTGGNGWQIVYTSDDELHFIDAIQFDNSSTGWISVFDRIYKTEDRGDSWSLLTKPFPDGFIVQFRFQPDGKHGWVAGASKGSPSQKSFVETYSSVPDGDGYRQLLSRTEDGGRTWHQMPFPSRKGISLWYILDDEHAWAIGDEVFSWQNGTWVKNNDAPGCDATEFLRNLHGGDSPSYPRAAYFLDSLRGWVSFSSGYVAKTTDGGKTWCDLLNPRTVWSTPGLLTYFERLSFIDADRGWGLDGDGRVYQTEDGGASWSKVIANVTFDSYSSESGRVFGISKDGLYAISATR
jgi:photosystem II stability/assembly factor-like uncharacterized protein